MNYSAVIIEDERKLREVFIQLLRENCPEIKVIGEAGNIDDGYKLILSQQPQVVFLDIEMPGMTGVDLVRSFTNPTFRVVFVTAYDAYAVEAFRVSAIDYLLKPIGSEDVIKVIQKIKSDVRNELGKLSIQLQNLDKLLNNHSDNSDQKIGIAMADKIVFINFANIIYCEASGPYTHVYLGDGQKLVSSKALGEFEAQLAGNKFFRIHHHYLINLNQVKEFQRHDGGYVIMENGKELEVSQRRRKDFLDAIQDSVV